MRTQVFIHQVFNKVNKHNRNENLMKLVDSFLAYLTSELSSVAIWDCLV